MYEVSLYKNIADTTSDIKTKIEVYLNSVKNGKYKKQIETLQGLSNKKEQTSFKKLLPNITASGLFKTRLDSSLIKHSGLIQIDFDKDKNQAVTPASAKSALIKDKFTFAAFISPTGTGVKLLVKIRPEQHGNIYSDLEKYYSENYQLNLDTTCRNLSRAMFVSYDPDLFHNPQSEVFSPGNISNLKNAAEKAPVAVILNDKAKEVDLLVRKIEENKTDITGNYDQWLKIGFALASEFGITGEDYFQKISQFSTSYDFKKCKIQYLECCKNRKSGIAINTLFAIAKNCNVFVHERKPDPKAKPVEETESGKVNMFIQVEKFLNSHYDLRFNEVTNRIEEKKKAETKWKDCNENNIFRFLMHNNISMSMTKLTALLRSDFIEVYNPFAEYFKSLSPYDSINEPDYIGNLSKHVYAKEQDRFNSHLKKHLVRCVACAVDDSYYNKQAFIIVHDKQNSGKSTFCRWFCPPDLEKYLGENVNLTNKDGEIALSEKFIINLDELAALSKYEINQLKSVMSRDKISIRRPFERSTSDSPRRCSFWGSTNRSEFLFDETGSVRWLCFEIELIDWDYKVKIDINNVWKQAYSLYLNGFKYDLTAQEIGENEIANNKFFMSTPEEDLLKKMYLPGNEKNNSSFLTSTDMLQKMQESCNNALKISPVVLGRILHKNGFIKSTVRINNSPTKGYYVSFA